MLENEKRWGYWTANIITILGIAFLLTGIIFFFAFNWKNMLPPQKFGTIELGILIFVMASLAYSSSALYLGLALTGASVLVGVFLAVFGQVYQTGADAYQLFAMWSLLILPWTIISRFAPLWAILGILLNATLILYWETFEYLLISLLILNILFLVIKEHLSFLAARWLRIVLVLWILILAYTPISDMLAILISPETPDLVQQYMHQKYISLYSIYLSGMVAITILAGLLYAYIKKAPDHWVVTLTLIEVSFLICVLISNILDKFNLDELLGLFIRLIIYLVVFAYMAYLLMRLKD